MVTGGVATLVPRFESTASTIGIINGRGGGAAASNEAGDALAANQSHPRSNGRLVIDSVAGVRCLLQHAPFECRIHVPTSEPLPSIIYPPPFSFLSVALASASASSSYLLSGQAHDGKVMLPDGSVLVFDRPTSVAELMLEHPRQYVLDLTSPSAAPLPADHLLEVGKAYVMLPMARGRATGLSTVEARRVLAAATQSMTKMILQPTCTHKVGAEWLGEEFEAGTEFFRRQHSSKRWKPSLGTIEEESLERKVPHWLL